MKHSKKRIASIIVLSVIIAAGALFTAVYDVLYKYTTNTTILNAASLDKRGETYWWMFATAKNGNETTTFNFDDGTYIVFSYGQGGGPDINTWTWNEGHGAACIAFYKGNNMTVQVGVDGGIGGKQNGNQNGGGKTVTLTNFALPNGYSGVCQAVVAGAGGGDLLSGSVYKQFANDGCYWTDVRDAIKVVDGTFKGWEGSNGDSTAKAMGFPGWGWPHFGLPATQEHGGYTGNSAVQRADTDTLDLVNPGCGGGAGWKDGGGSTGLGCNSIGGGGSCSPSCYPLYSSDSQNGPKYPSGEHAGEFVRASTNWGGVNFARIDPERTPTVNNAVYGNTALVSDSNTLGNRYTPVTAVQLVESAGTIANYDCGIRVGWVYSVSEDGEKWGACSDRLRSETEQDV